jgi:hypothetical protein
MADTRAQGKVEVWIRENWLPRKMRQPFDGNRKVRLRCGGFFEFDAVSRDRKTLVAISTSKGVTKSGRRAVGKVRKIQADLYFLVLAKARRRALVFTEADMYERFKKERDEGRVPKEVKLFLVERIPAKLSRSLVRARSRASLSATSG